MLAADLQRREVQRSWRSALSPRLSYGRHSGPLERDARHAAVAILLCRSGEMWSLPLTLRSDNLVRHRGQVSFPGGIVDEGETACEAASREVAEELGAEPKTQWIGEFDPLYVYASNTIITPCVGLIDHRPQWIANPAEVAKVLTLEIEQLLSMDAEGVMTIRRGKLAFSAPCILVDNEKVWGSTAILLGELRGRLLRASDSLEGGD